MSSSKSDKNHQNPLSFPIMTAAVVLDLSSHYYFNAEERDLQSLTNFQLPSKIVFFLNSTKGVGDRNALTCCLCSAGDELTEAAACTLYHIIEL